MDGTIKHGMRLAGVGIATLLTIPCVASANSVVGAGNGAISVTGDSAHHEFVIHDSRVNIQPRTWTVKGTAIAASWVTFGPELAQRWSRLRASYLAVWRDAIAKLPVTLPPEITPSIFEGSPELDAELLDLVDRNLALTAQNDLYDKMDEIGPRIDRFERLGQMVPPEVQAQWDALEDIFENEIDDMNELKDDLANFELRLQASNRLSAQAKQTVGNFTRKLRIGYESVQGMLTRFLRFAETLGKIGGGIAVFSSLLNYYTDDTIVIEDRTGHGITALPPCNPAVRETSGEAGNAVSCPNGNPESLFYIFSQSQWGLSVYGGTGDDDIVLDLSGRDSPFGSVFVNGGEGNDRIVGSDKDDSLSGGPGDDLIRGLDGDDLIRGNEMVPLGNTPDGNDRLFGGRGEDIVGGDAGNDFVSGGPDSDWRWWGAALDGGNGNDVVVGGKGRDELSGGPGRDTLQAKESDFGFPEEADYVVDCGTGPGTQYMSLSQGTVTDQVEGTTCGGPPSIQLTRPYLVDPETHPNPTTGNWPWYH